MKKGTNESRVVKIGKKGAGSVGKLVGYENLASHYRPLKALFAELVLGRRRSPVQVFTDFHSLRERYGLSAQDLNNNYIAFKRSCLISYCAAGIVLAWMVDLLVFGRWMDSLGACGVWALFASNAVRFSFYCYEYRLERFVRFRNWLYDPSAWWPADWTCPVQQPTRSKVVVLHSRMNMAPKQPAS